MHENVEGLHDRLTDRINEVAARRDKLENGSSSKKEDEKDRSASSSESKNSSKDEPKKNGLKQKILAAHAIGLRRPYVQALPDVDAGFTEDDVRDPKKAETVYRTIQQRMDKDRQARPGGYLVREAPKEDLEKLKILKGHLKAGQFVTKIRKSFTKDEMDDDLLIVPAQAGDAQDVSEYTEVLPTSPP